MTTKEITALRKAGQLEEAMAAAEQEFKLNANKYTANALFWCLNDKIKKETVQEVIRSIYERMKSLWEEYCPQDEIMQNSLCYIEKRTNPLRSRILNAKEQAKAGHNNNDFINDLQNTFDNGALDNSLLKDYGWLIYYTLKNTDPNNVGKREQLLHNYLRLELPRPDLLHSLILNEVVNMAKNTLSQFRLRNFMTMWGWENFREEDWQQFQPDNGHTSQSLVESLISVYAKELNNDGVTSPIEFEEIVDKALERFPNNQYIPSYKASVLRSKGEYQQALDYYKLLILRTPSKYNFWHQVSRLVEDPDTRIALLCKAINIEGNEDLKGKCRLDLAKTLVEKGHPANAKSELSIYRNHYQLKGWRLKQEYYDIERMIPTAIAAQDNEALYKKYLPLAEEFIYSGLPSIMAIKVSDRQMDDRNRPGRKFTQWTLRTKDATFHLKKTQKFGLNKHALNGSVYDIKLYNGKIVWISKSEQNPLQQDWVKMTEGLIRLRIDRNGNTYSIIDGVYVGRKLLDGISDSQAVKVVALKQEDGRWSAISLKIV